MAEGFPHTRAAVLEQLDRFDKRYPDVLALAGIVRGTVPIPTVLTSLRIRREPSAGP